MSFEQHESGIANAYRYKGISVRFTYRVDVGRNLILGMDIDAQLPGDEHEVRLHTLNGSWQTREEALNDAKDWTAGYLDMNSAQA